MTAATWLSLRIKLNAFVDRRSTHFNNLTLTFRSWTSKHIALQRWPNVHLYITARSTIESPPWTDPWFRRRRARLFVAAATAAAFTYQTYEKITAAVGDTVVLPCRTTLGVPVDWKYMMTNESQQPTYVYSNFVIYAEYLDKATTEQVNPATGRYDLTLHNVQLNDSGWFVCIEDGGLAEVHVRALDVSGKIMHVPSTPCCVMVWFSSPNCMIN